MLPQWTGLAFQPCTRHECQRRRERNGVEPTAEDVTLVHHLTRAIKSERGLSPSPPVTKVIHEHQTLTCQFYLVSPVRWHLPPGS